MIVQQQQKTVYPFIFPTQFGGMTSINCYLYKCESGLFLIDAGIDSTDFQDFFYQQLQQYNLSIDEIDAIIITHHHGDHIGMVNALVEKRNIPVYAHPLAVERLHMTERYQRRKIQFYEHIYKEYGCETFGAPRIETIRRNYKEQQYPKLNCHIRELVDGDSIGDLQVIHAPGHSPDTIMLFDKDTTWLFAGDNILLHKNTSALVDFDEQQRLLPSVTQYDASLTVIEALQPSFCFSGHEPIIQHVHEAVLRNQRRVQIQLQRVIRAVTEGHHTVQAIGEALYKERFQSLFIFIFSEIVGYANMACELGLLENVSTDHNYFYKIIENKLHFSQNEPLL